MSVLGLSSAGLEEAALRSSLSRLLVVHCSSSSQLLLTLHYLETTLNSRPSLALLLIDSISAFYWLDRCEGGASISRQEEKLSKCAELLGRLLRSGIKTSVAVPLKMRPRGPAGTLAVLLGSSPCSKS